MGKISHEPESYRSQIENLKSMMDSITSVTVEEEPLEDTGAGMDAEEEEIERLKKTLRNLGYL